MLGRLQIILEKPKGILLNVNISSLLQGVIMEQISYESALEFHNGGRQPYSQYVVIEPEHLVWNIQTLTEKAYEQMLVPLLDEKVTSIYLRKKELRLPVLQKKVDMISYKQLLKERYFTDGSRFQKFCFVSPVSFKSKGEYVFFPSVHLLFQSLMLKYDAVSQETDLFEKDVMEYFEKNIKIIKYRLRSYDFHLEGIKVPAFLGEITLKINGSQSFVNLVNYLVAFGEYAGVGIKSSIGMGGYQLVEERKRKRE